MKAMIRKELTSNRRNLLIWIGAMVGLMVIGAAEYSLVVVEAGDEIMELFETLPYALAVVFGAETIPVDTPLGYFVMMYLWYCLIAFTHAAVLGATIISKEEQNRTAEFLFTKPFTRKTIISSKMIAAVISVLIMTMTTLIGNFVLLVPQMEGNNIYGEILLMMFSLFIIQVLFLFLGLFCSAVISSYGKAVSASIGFVVFSYILMIFIELAGTIDYLIILTPFMYFKGAPLVLEGFNPFYLIVALGVILIAGHQTISNYKDRDIHS